MNFISQMMIFSRCAFSAKGFKLLTSLVVFFGLIAGTIIALFSSMPMSQVHATSRLKDIITVEGIRDNILVGYGLVVGLDGTGDKLTNSPFTEKSLQSFLGRMGVSTDATNLKAKNVAAVTVTATLPPFARAGSRIDVTISAIGDSKSLSGGTLVATPLMGADSELYAVAQGAIAIGGFEASGDSGSSVSKGVATSGFISNGAIVEREIAFELNDMESLNLSLRNPDITTAKQIAQAINQEMNAGLAVVRDPGTIALEVPEDYSDSVALLLAEIEQLEVVPDQSARIIIDEASGTIVMNENVRIDTVAIAQGNLVVRVQENPQIVQPGAFANGQTAVQPQTVAAVEEGRGSEMAIIDETANLRELVDGLNSLGVGPRDLITILQTIKSVGALQAEIETR